MSDFKEELVDRVDVVPYFRNWKKVYLKLTRKDWIWSWELLNLNEESMAKSKNTFKHKEICITNAEELTEITQSIEATMPDLSQLS